MEKYLEITNEGEVELYGLTLLGASSKENDATKIGFFGSGNKYAISCLLRNNIPFKIYSGLEEVLIETKPVNFREETFEQIIINNQPTSFTTRMGPKWEIWFALREFVCNALDEGEANPTKLVEAIVPEEQKTKIYVETTSHQVADFAKNLDQYILNGKTNIVEIVPSSTFGSIQVLEKPILTPLKIYRKGIRVFEGSDTQISCFDYNVEKISINESRMVERSYEVLDIVLKVICDTQEKKIPEKILQHKYSYEFDKLDNISSYKVLNESWYKALEGKIIVPDSLTLLLGKTTGYGSLILPKEFCKALGNRRSLLGKYNISIEGVSERVPSVEVEVSETAKKEIQELIENLKKLNIDFNLEPRFMKVHENYNDTVAWFDNKQPEMVFINSESLLSITEEVLFEEYCHSLGYDDCSRQFQEFLMKEVIKLRKQLANLKQPIEFI